MRLGSRELSIIDPKAVAALHSAQSPCTKGPRYNGTKPRVSLQNSRDKQEHGQRRRVWDRGFSSKSLRDYESRVVKYTSELLSAIEDRKGEPLSVTTWFNFFSFDVMGDLSFGKSFRMLETGVQHHFITSLHASMVFAGYLRHLSWMFKLITSIPILNRKHRQFWNFVNAQVEERIKMKPDQPDIFSWLLADYAQKSSSKQAKLNLQADAYLIVIAGSDTTAAALTSLFFHLATEPHLVPPLRKEIDKIYETEGFTSSSLSKCTLIDAYINETLRLYPPVPSGLQRVTPPEGIMIGETHIPGDTIVLIPSYTISRDERNFSRPNEFIPERWTSKPELVQHPEIHNPFSIGTYSCIGKQLALMELRFVIAEIIRRYDVAPVPGYDTTSYTEGLTDTVILSCPQLELIFSDRKSA